MARKKRASLKDKTPETLGLTPKKGKGLDVLFGGPLDQEEASLTRSNVTSQSDPVESNVTNQPKSEVENMSDKNNAELSSAPDNVTTAPPPAANNVVDSSPRSVDEFGLPVAFDTPPPDLADAGDGREVDELGLPVALDASPPEASNIPANREVDELGLPVAMEAPPADLSVSVPVAPPPIEDQIDTIDLTESDLSGLLESEEDLPLASDTLSSPPGGAPAPDDLLPPPPSPTAAPFDIATPSPTPSLEPTFAPPVESSFEPLPTPPPVSPTPTYTPPLSPAPLPAVPYTPTPTPSTPATPVAYTPPPPPPPQRIESFSGIVTEGAPVSARDLIPTDVRYAPASHIIGVEERAQVTKDEAITEKIVLYLGEERIRRLDQEIEALYRQVEDKLSVLGEDAEYALKTLREAQDILLEDPRQYDEALYRVAVVRTMLNRKQNLENWSWKWGLYIFYYALFWLLIFSAGFLATDFLRGMINQSLAGGSSADLNAIRAAWFSALAGGIGGVIDVMWSLYWRVSVKQNFDPQYLMYYLVKPIMGFFLGALIFFISTAGFFITNISETWPVNQIIALQIVLGFIAGFRQEFVFSMIHKIIKSISPEKPDEKPDSLVPADRSSTSTPGLK